MNSWVTKQLKEICEKIDYGYTASAVTDKIGPKFLRITDIAQDLIDWQNVPYCKITDADSKKYKLESGDIVIARTGATSGYAKTLKKGNPESVFASYLVRIRPNSDTNKFFIGQVVESNQYKQFIKSNIGGSAQPQANAKVLTSYPIKLPSIVIQQKIASILSAFDDLIENNNKRIKILEQIAQSIYREWFVNFKFPGHEKVKMVESESGKIPQGWKIKTILDTFQTILGGTPSRDKPEYWGGTIPWVNSGKVNKFRVTEASEYITEDGLKKSSAKLMPLRTTLIAITGATLGQVSLTEIETTGNQSVVVVFDINGEYNEYIYLYIKNNIQKIINKASGGAQQHINKDIVNETIIIIPDQDNINKFNNVIRPIFDQIKISLKANTVLIKTKNLLLPKLISGELDVENLDIKIRPEIL